MNLAERKAAIARIIDDITIHHGELSWHEVVVLNTGDSVEDVRTFRATFEHYRLSTTHVHSKVIGVTATIASIHDTEDDYLLMLGGAHGYDRLAEVLWKDANAQSRRN